MIRPLLSLERLSLDEQEGKVCYRYGEGAEELERMDHVFSHALGLFFGLDFDLAVDREAGVAPACNLLHHSL